MDLANRCNRMAMCALLILLNSQEMPPLEQLTLRFTGSRLADASGLAQMLDTEQCLASLKSLQLWFSNLPLAAEFLCQCDFGYHATSCELCDFYDIVSYNISYVSTSQHVLYIELKRFLRSLVELGSWEPLTKLQLEELVLQLKRCGQVPAEAKQSLILRCIHCQIATLPHCHIGTTHPPS